MTNDVKEIFGSAGASPAPPAPAALAAKVRTLAPSMTMVSPEWNAEASLQR